MKKMIIVFLLLTFVIYQATFLLGNEIVTDTKDNITEIADSEKQRTMNRCSTLFLSISKRL